MVEAPVERRGDCAERRYSGGRARPHYFPLEAVDPAVLKPSTTTSGCPWKGTAQYYTLVVDGAASAARTGLPLFPWSRACRVACPEPRSLATSRLCAL